MARTNPSFLSSLRDSIDFNCLNPPLKRRAIVSVVPPGLSCRSLHDFDFVIGQVVEFIDGPVDLRVGGGNLAFERGFLLLARLQSLMSPQNKPVIHAFGLVVFQRRQVSERG